MEYALDPSREIMLAYEMNDEDIPAVHGYPIRLVCPGMIAVRSCKWVSQLIISDVEADHAAQRRDYKYVTDVHDMTKVDWTKYDPIYFTGVNSGIGLPELDSEVEISTSDDFVEISGWA
jgi:DMSO/TMAO reductase YedYZ molybdopterin-dependent catalytic subunit